MEKQIRLFVQITLPEEIKEKLFRLGKELPEECIKPVEKNNLHLTLKFIGKVKYSELSAINNALSKIRFSPFEIKLKGVGVFPNKHFVKVVWIGCESKELGEFAERVNACLDEYGDKKEFSAHITIARVRRRMEIDDFLKKYGETEFGTIEVKSFELMQSILSRGKPPKYEVLSSYGA